MTPNPDWLEILRAAHHEPLDPAHYTAVRARVLAEIEASRKPWRSLAWISGIAAVTAAVLLLTLAPPLGRPRLAPLPNVAFTIPAAPPAPELAAAVPAPAPLPRPKREPLTIQLQTSDPNIVIYWIAE